MPCISRAHAAALSTATALRKRGGCGERHHTSERYDSRELHECISEVRGVVTSL
jgi:hypothetical protein